MAHCMLDPGHEHRTSAALRASGQAHDGWPAVSDACYEGEAWALACVPRRCLDSGVRGPGRAVVIQQAGIPLCARLRGCK